MKIYKSILRFLALTAIVSSAASCTDDYEKFNKNPYEPGKDEMEYDGYMMRSALTTLQAWVVPLDVNACQFTECLLGGSYSGYLSDSHSGFNNKNFATYVPEEGWALVLFNDFIPKIFPALKDLKNATDDPVPLAVGNVIKVMAMQRITDTYGPIPYSKIGEDGSLTAPYDSQEEVYKHMFAELDEAIDALTEHRTEDFAPNADMVYDGVAEKWIKLANSLKLRLAIRIANVSPALAKQKAEEAAKHEVGVMTANADNASRKVPTTNPFRVVCYEYNGGDSHVSADITSYMNGYEDPRRDKYFTKSTFTDEELAGKKVTENGFYGLRSGVYMPAGDMIKHYANINVAANSRVQWMNAAEVAFLRAEGAMRGWDMGSPVGETYTSTAEGFYKMGIRLSFGQWSADGADSYMENSTLKPQMYEDPMGLYNYDKSISSITIQWKSAGSFEENMERIITQKWIANFPLGLEAWAEYRRTGYPKLMQVMINNSGGKVSTERMARRLSYPQSERTENSENLNEAISKYLNGPDTMGTDVWWAKKD